MIESLARIGIIVDWHLAEVIGPMLKLEKVENFSTILREMSSIEVDNSNFGAQ